RAGPRPTGMSCEIAMTWNAAPAQGNAIVNARGAGRPPRNGASTNAVANPYSANAMRCRVTITADPGQAHQRGPGGLSGRHLLDQPYGKTRLQRGVADLQQETGGGFFARVHDHHHGAHFFRCRARIQLGRFIYLEDVTNGDPVPTALVDEIELLRAGDRVRVARAEQLAREPLCHRCGTHLPGVAERLERHRDVALVNARELRDDLRQNLLALDLRHAGNPDRHHDIAPIPRFEPGVEPGEQQRVADVIGRVVRRLDRDFLELVGRGALRQSMNRWFRGRTQDLAPREPLGLTQEAGRIKLPGAHRTIWLMDVGP